MSPIKNVYRVVLSKGGTLHIVAADFDNVISKAEEHILKSLHDESIEIEIIEKVCKIDIE